MQRWVRLLAVVILVSMLGSTITPAFQPAFLAAKTAAAAEPTADSGELRLSPAIDQDGNTATNPTEAHPVSVLRFGGLDQDEAVIYSVVMMGVEVHPDDPMANPAGVPVTMRLWNDALGIDIEHTAFADAWGAVAFDFTLDEKHLGGRFAYQASAPGMASTPIRTFIIDPKSVSSDTVLGDLRLSAELATDGKLQATITANKPFDYEGGAQLYAVRLTAQSEEWAEPTRELLPPMIGRQITPTEAQADVYLDAGWYMLTAIGYVDGKEVQSAPQLIEIASVVTPELAEARNAGAFDFEAETALIEGRTEAGDLVLQTRPLGDIPDARPAGNQRTFSENVRISPFEWRTDSYTITTETQLDDGKKYASLEGFHYDPIARRYDIAVYSLMDEPVEDKLTVQILGPNGVVIHEETTAILLDPAVPVQHSVVVPSDVGEPQGLRIIVHDPLDLSWLIQKSGEILSSVFNALASTGSIEDGFTLTVGFKGSLKVLGIDIISASILCAIGNGCQTKTSGLVFQPGNWLDIVTTGVRDYLRSKFGAGSIDDALKKLFLNGIDLGAASLSATVGGRYTKNLYDPIKCPDPESEAAIKEYAKALGKSLKELGALITFKFKKVSEKFQGKAFADLPVPGVWFLSISLSPILAFKVEGGSSGDYGVYGELQVEYGIKGTLLLNSFSVLRFFEKLIDLKYFVEGLWELFETIKLGQQLFSLIAAATKQKPGQKDCDPPPPNGSPDDRLDAFQNQYMPTAGGNSGAIAHAQGQIAIAQSKGLTRAATYWTLELRRAEYATWAADTDKLLASQEEVSVLFANAEAQIGGLISGTIDPEPGQTITEAVELIYTDLGDDLDDTAYDKERREYLNSIDFAQRQYMALRGQELELQRELRLMADAAGVGVVDSGLVRWAMGAIGSVGITPMPVQIVPGVTASRLPNSRYYSPYEAPKVIIVPSGGLSRYGDSQQAREWLATFVSAGGTLIVLAQADSDDWEMLPGGEVRGLGYNQDILCKTKSVDIVNPSPWIAGIDRNQPDIQIDGSFLAWPTNATITLMRTTGNKMPAQIEYGFGNGTVVATAAYPDFYINGLQSLDDIIYARSLYSLAYLEGTGESVADAAGSGEMINITTQITNTTASTVTEVTVWGDYYTDKIAESWRWQAHQPYQLRATQVISLEEPLAPNSSGTITMAFPAPMYAGVYRSAYHLTSNGRWWSSGAIPGPFYQVISEAVAVDLIGFKLFNDQTDYIYGQEAVITAQLENTSAQTKTYVLAPESGLPTTPVTLTVGPESTGVHTYTTRVWQQSQVRVNLREDGQRRSTMTTMLRLRPAAVGVTTADLALVAGITTTMPMTASAIQVSDGTDVTWEIREDGVLLETFTTPVFGDETGSTAAVTVTLPAAEPKDTFTIDVSLPNNQATQRTTLEVQKPGELDGAQLLAAPLIGAETAAALEARIDVKQWNAEGSFEVLVRQQGQILATSDAITAALTPGANAVELPLVLPQRLNLAAPATIIINGNIQAEGATSAYTTTWSLPLPIGAPETTVSASELVVRDPLTLTLKPQPQTAQLPVSGPYTVTITGITAPFSATEIFTEASALDGALTFGTTVPELVRGGVYEMGIQAPWLSGWRGTARWRVAPHAITANFPSSGDSGDILTWEVSNVGGVDTIIDGQLSLIDQSGRRVSTQYVYEELPAQGSIFVPFSLGSQLKSGNYELRWRGTDHLGDGTYSVHPISLEGLDIEMTTESDRFAYLTTDPITTTTVITADATLSDASLRVQVLKAVGGWIGWGSRAANSARTNAIDPLVTGPFTGTWAREPGYIGIPPVAVNELVYTAERPMSNTIQDPDRQGLEWGEFGIVATDSATGNQQWTAYYNAPPKEMGANRSMIYVLTTGDNDDTGLIAFDNRTGERRWFAPDAGIDDLIVSDEAVAVFDPNRGGYVIYDPYRGTQIDILTADHSTALLIERTFIYQNAEELIAYDVFNEETIWTSPLVSAATLLTGNSQRIVSTVNQAGSTTVFVHNTQTGAFERTVLLGTAPQNPPPQTTPGTINGAPLRIQVFNTTQTAVFYDGFQQFYNNSASGLYLLVNDVVYGPPSVPAGNNATPYTFITQTATLGSGIIADPWRITTQLSVTNTPLLMNIEYTYVQGDPHYQTNVTLINTDPLTGVQYRLSHAADLYPSNPVGTASDSAYGYYDQDSGAVGAFQNDPWYQLFEPITPASAYQEGRYNLIWDQIGEVGTVGPGFNNTIDPAYKDSGAGLQWDGMVEPGGQVVIKDRMRFASAPVASSPMLHEQTLHYLVNKPTPQGVQTTIYAVDLVDGTAETFYEATSDIRSMIATDDLFYLIDRSTSSLITMDPSGTILDTRSLIEEVPFSTNVDGIVVSDKGMVITANGGSQVNMLEASVDLAGSPSGAMTVLEESWHYIDGNSNFTLTDDFSWIVNDQRARGELYLKATLFSNMPGDEMETKFRHVLAEAQSTFTIDDADGAANLSTLNPVYRVNDPATAVDDAAATVELQASVRNLSPLPSQATLTVERINDGTTIATLTTPELAVGETYTTIINDPNPPTGPVTYTLSNSLGGEATIDISVLEPLVLAFATFDKPTIAAGLTSTLDLVVANDGVVPAFVTIDLGDGAEPLELAPGVSIRRSQVLSPAATGPILVPITVSGDLERTLRPTLDVRDESGLLELTLLGTMPEPGVMVQTPDAALTLARRTTSPYLVPTILDWTIAGPVERSGSDAALLDDTATLTRVSLSDLTPGSYTLTATLRHAEAATALDIVSQTFTVVAPVITGELDAQWEIDNQGNALITLTVDPATTNLSWNGTLHISGAQADALPLTLVPGVPQTITRSLDLASRSGPQPLAFVLEDSAGNLIAETGLDLHGALRAAAGAKLIEIRSNGGNTGAMATLEVVLSAADVSGDVLVDVVAFDTLYQLVVPVGATTATASLRIPVPTGLLAGDYPISASVGEQEVNGAITVAGAALELSHSLDAQIYEPWSNAIWTVELTATAGLAASYDVEVRYGSLTLSETIELAAGASATLPFEVPVGPVSDRATVLVSNHRESEAEQRFTLLIDSQYLPVRDDNRAWLMTDKPRYQAGETVELTYVLPEAVQMAAVIAPTELSGEDGPLLWSSAILSDTTYVSGTFTMTFPLPEALSTGRYAFTYLFDGEERTLPIDVFGTTLRTANMTVVPQAEAATLPLSISVDITLDQAVTEARVRAWGLDPDGTYVNLGPTAAITTDLPLGTSTVALDGLLAATQPGAHQIVLVVEKGPIRLGGDAAFVDVGTATIAGLRTSQGIYAPGEAGTATLEVFGTGLGAADVSVTTSGGTPLFTATITTSGYLSDTFTIPTAIEGDELLVALITDTLGLTTTQIAAYKVATDFDITAPEITTLTPSDGTTITWTDATSVTLITVTGIVTEAEELAEVIVNGVAAEIDGATWTVELPVTAGATMIQAVARDAAGNIGVAPLTTVYGEPGYGITLEASTLEAQVGQTLTFTAEVTSTSELSATALFPFSNAGFTVLSSEATTGTVTVVDGTVRWTGMVSPTEPVTVVWTARTTQPHEALEIHALVQGFQLRPRQSNSLELSVDGLFRLFLPTVRR